jgi:hypothetical protein
LEIDPYRLARPAQGQQAQGHDAATGAEIDRPSDRLLRRETREQYGIDRETIPFAGLQQRDRPAEGPVDGLTGEGDRLVTPLRAVHSERRASTSKRGLITSPVTSFG